MRRFLNPKNDFAFKRVFGTEKNKDILIAFLNSVFEGVHDKIEDVEFLPLHQDPKIAALRQSIVDVKCTDLRGRQFIVEIQCYSDSYFIKRACVYAARAYADQLVDGTEYRDVKPVIFLAILDFNLLDDDRYLSHNKVLDIDTGRCNIEEFSFSFLELKKFNKNFEESKTLLEKWCYFLKHAQKTKQDELEVINSKYPIVGKAYTVLEQYGYTREELDEYMRYDMGADAIATSLRDAEERGMALGEKRGRKAGIKESRKEAALSMLADKLPIEAVSKYTGLSKSEVLKLQKVLDK